MGAARVILVASKGNIATVPERTTRTTRSRLPQRTATTLLSLFALGSATAARALPYDPASRAWDGLGGFVEQARREGIDVLIPARLDPASLDPRDALAIVAPASPPPTGALVAFVEQGGRLLLADDTGVAEPLLRAFGVSFEPEPSPRPPLLEGQPGFPIALAGTEQWHPLLAGVRAVVTNQPAAIRHPQVRPLLGLGRCQGEPTRCGQRPGILLSGVVGEGRLIALADPSVLIDGMLRFEGNRRLARTLPIYLTEAGKRRLLLATPATRWPKGTSEALEEASLPPLARLRRRLAEISGRPAPGWLLRAASLGMLLGLAAFGLLRGRRHDPYQPETMMGPSPPPGGVAGQIAFHLEHPGSLVLALRTWAESFQDEMAEFLGLSPDATVQETLAALERYDRAAADRVRRLLRAVAAAIERTERVPAHPALHPKELRRFVREGQELLDELSTARPSWGHAPRSTRRPRR